MGGPTDQYGPAVDASGALLASFDVLTPVGELGADQAIVFTLVDGPDDSVIHGFEVVPAFSIESYTGPNQVQVASLSPEGLSAYARGAVRDALSVLPQETALELMADLGWNEDMELHEALDAANGNVSLDQAVDLMRGGLIEAFSEFRMHANNMGDESPLSAEEIEGLDRTLTHLEIAQDLAGYTNALKTALEDGLGVEAGMAPQEVELVLGVLEGRELQDNSLQFKQ